MNGSKNNIFNIHILGILNNESRRKMDSIRKLEVFFSTLFIVVVISTMYRYETICIWQHEKAFIGCMVLGVPCIICYVVNIKILKGEGLGE